MRAHRIELSGWKTVSFGLLLIAATAFAYLPAWHAGFIWDDDVYVTRNPLLTAPDGLRRIWFSTDAPSQYFPLVYTTFRLEHAGWGLNPIGYHGVNILLHALNAVLAWQLLRRLAIPGAWLAAAIFALHPVNVESVAWITELKNVESLFFVLLTLLAWVAFVDRTEKCRTGSSDLALARQSVSGSKVSGITAGSGAPALHLKPQLAWPYYGVALLAYALALFSKTTACTLPAALVVILWLKRERIDARRLLQIVPFVALGIGMGLLTVWWERHHQGTSAHDFASGPLDRVLIASRAVWFYLSKLIWPTALTFIYPLWTIDRTDPTAYLWLVALVVAGVVVFLLRRRVGRGVESAAVFYLATLSPVLGFIMLYTFHFSFVADHYQYVASLGPIALGAAAAATWRFTARIGAPLRTASAAAVLLLLGALTWRQCGMYADIETLWRTTLARDPSSYIAHNSLSLLLLKKGEVDAALVNAERALELQRDANNHVLALINIGNARLQKGEIDAAVASFRQATQIDPASADAHNNFGSALLQKGEADAALAELREALTLEPQLASAHYNLGSAMLSRGVIDAAIAEFQRALELDPTDGDTRLNLGSALLMQGRIDEARREFEALLRQQPASVQAMSNLAFVFSRQDHAKESAALYRKALEVEPANAATLSSFAWLLATTPDPTVRNGAEALAVAERADKIAGGRDPLVLRALAAAYAEAGRYADAAKSIPKAIELAESSGRNGIVPELREELKQYEAGRSLAARVQ